MKTLPNRGATAVLLCLILLTGLICLDSAQAYHISYYHYVFATGGPYPNRMMVSSPMVP